MRKDSVDVAMAMCPIPQTSLTIRVIKVTQYEIWRWKKDVKDLESQLKL